VAVYQDLANDFPERCLKVLERCYPVAEGEGIEVTLMLMVASAGFLIPFERLRPPGKYDRTAHDRKVFDQKASKLSELLKANFVTSALHAADATRWEQGEVESDEDNPTSWIGWKDRAALAEDVTAEKVLTTIRNALGHGNIRTVEDPIRHLIFLSAKCYSNVAAGYNFVSMSPSDFHNFLVAWFEFLNDRGIPQEVVAEAFNPSTSALHITSLL
jgi:hypothetical protein